MAKSLQYTPRVRTPQEEVAEASAQNAEALVEGLKLLSALHDHGVLDVLNKVVRGGGGLAGESLHILERGSSTHVIRNLLEVVRVLTELDPQSVGALGRALNEGVNEGAKRVARGERVGVGELVGLMRDPDIQVALTALFGTLKGFGHALRQADAQMHEPVEERRTSGERLA
ncbi:DUF1641 domain-containing protein [Deinococcus planocerae]|uniref:DUF1641 domain-containing protein n=1 Tax=Deinococcus planocerae TaxID=1737569 RepID=UPI000C7F3903|nr:DUF1641 domain-containing protein [Deinococcus planocerae]